MNHIWKRIEDEPHNPELVLCERVFGLDGAPYPRIKIAFNKISADDMALTVHYKEREETHWMRASMDCFPANLTGDIIEMIQHAEEKLNPSDPYADRPAVEELRKNVAAYLGDTVCPVHTVVRSDEVEIHKTGCAEVLSLTYEEAVVLSDMLDKDSLSKTMVHSSGLVFGDVLRVKGGHTKVQVLRVEGPIIVLQELQNGRLFGPELQKTTGDMIYLEKVEEDGDVDN